MQTSDIRRAYLAHFESQNHRIFPSAPLVPANDPSLLFTVAGMVQFKDALTGRETTDYKRAASCQLCVRAGGKHNDLDNVGYTARHHTLFEMLGNFSFGDYFKEESIVWAWDFVTNVLQFDRDRIWITVHPTDDEARQLWIKKIGIAADRVVDHEENFWEMGDTGPCGPNTELFYDQGSAVTGGPPGTPDEDGDRYLEFWNLVFPQFDRQPDGELLPLKNFGVDTGLGLERTAALVQGVLSDYETDVFQDLVRSAAELAPIGGDDLARNKPSLHVIADHIRSCSFLIGDGVIPSNEGRGYVLRRVIRRAIRHGNKLGIEEPFFHRLVQPLAATMGDAYPRIAEAQKRIASVLEQEEEQFAGTLRNGMAILESEIEDLAAKQLPGDLVFKLYDTYGFPVDLTADIARERGLGIDEQGYSELMEQQRVRARSSAQFKSDFGQAFTFDSAVVFDGYDAIDGTAQILDLIRVDSDSNGEQVAELSEGERGIVILDRTCFYGEAGGQVGDTGSISTNDGIFTVKDTQRSDQQFLHEGQATKGVLRRGDSVSMSVDDIRRQDIARNHSATHLLHAALKNVLGSHVVQRGSLVASDRLRFDFSHDGPVLPEELSRIEHLVNDEIARNTRAQTSLMSYDDAIENGAVALFGEKYGDEVRVLDFGDGFSVELCGGTHVEATGEIGMMKIVSQSGIAAGVRRVEAVTGRGIQQLVQDNEDLLSRLSELANASSNELEARFQGLIDQNEQLQKELDTLRQGSVKDESQSLLDDMVTVSDVNVIAAQIEGDTDSMMSMYDELRASMSDYVIALAVVDDGTVHLVCGVAKGLTKSLRAGDLIKHLGEQVGARGGGRPEMARGGGGDQPEKLPAALDSVVAWVEEQLT